MTWLAAMQVVTSRCGGQPEKLAAIGLAEFTVLVRQAVARVGAATAARQAWYGRAVFAALASTEGVVVSHRRALLRRCADELGDLQPHPRPAAGREADMAAVLGELGLSRLADIPGLTAVGAAAILAETGDPRRYDSSSSLVKHAGLSPSGNASGAFEGQAHISRRGRPGLRLTVWRAIWPLLIHNSVMAAKYAAMIAAADAAARRRTQSGTGRQPSAAGRAAAARRPGLRAPPRCCAGSTAWSSIDTGWDPAMAASRHRLGSRRRPLADQQLASTPPAAGGGRLEPRFGQLDLQGRASPHPPRGSPRR